MSRVDEALRRAAEDRGEDVQRSGPAAGAEAWTIASYPVERAPASRRLERVVPRAPLDRVPADGTPWLDGDGSDARPVDGDRLVTSPRASAVYVEQYRRLAAALHDAQIARQLKTVAVTSAVAREGKSYVAVNLALTLSGSYGRRVLLIDADLRRPSVHEILGASNATGLADVLAATRHQLPLIDVSPRLSLLPAGKLAGSPLAVLSSHPMRELLDECAGQFDWVLIDTPPVGVLSDAQIVARLAGGVLFVIAAGSTPFDVVERAVDGLGRECILGTVLNRIDESAVPHSDYYADWNQERKESP